MSEKMWGSEPFWGLGYEWDPDWVSPTGSRSSARTLIELCEKEMRANAKRSDDELLFPRRNLELLGEHGFLGLTVPEEYGGLGENHVAYSMVCETIARYGCASTAMCYVMHIGAVKAIMLRPTPELVDKYIRPLNRARSARSPTPTPRRAPTSGTRSPRAPSARTAATRCARRRRGRRRAASPTSTSSRPRAPTSRATTTSRSSWSTASTSRRSPRCGTRSGCAATSRAPIEIDDVEIPGDAARRADGRRRRRRTTSPSTRGS